MDFKGKVAIVTGGARNIGRAITEALLEKGAKVLFVDLLYKDGEATQSELGAKFGQENVLYMRVDVGSSSNFEEAFIKCKDHFGTVDILVNNAGTNAETNWETQLNINLLGTIRGTKLALKYMAKNGRSDTSSKKGGIVLNVSSVQGLVHWPAMPTYSAGKAAINAYVRCSGHELEFANHGVRMMSLCPMSVETTMRDFEIYVGMSKVGSDFLYSLDHSNSLKTDDLGRAAIYLMEKANTATVWYLHKRGNDPVEIVDETSYEKLCQLAKQ